MHDESIFRWLLLVVLVANFGMSAFFRRRARQASGTIPRQDEGGVFIVLRLLLTLPLMAAILAYLVNPGWMAWATVDLPAVWRWLGTALGFATVGWMYWVLTHIGRNISETTLTKAEHELVTTGPYRFIRHPLYTGGLAMLAGVALMTASWLIALWTTLGLPAFLAFVIPREEAALVEKFGARYRDYRRRTGRLLPRVL